MQKFNGNYYKMRLIEEKFIVKEDNGIVICRQRYMISDGISYKSIKTFDYNLYGKIIEVSGIARCSGGDEFDEKTGRIIAQTKASVKAYEKYEKWAKSVSAEAEKLAETCANTVLAAEDFRTHEKDKLDELTGGSDDELTRGSLDELTGDSDDELTGGSDDELTGCSDE